MARPLRLPERWRFGVSGGTRERIEQTVEGGEVSGGNGKAFAAVALLALACSGDATAPQPAEPQPPSPPANRAPAATGEIPGQRLPGPGEAASVDVAAYFNDPDGDSLTFAATSSDTAVVRAAATGSQVDLTGGSVGGEGTVTASDPAGLAATASFAVAVNRPPVASEEIPTQSLLIEGLPVDVDVSGFFSDPDGDSLTFAATSSDAAVVAASTAEAVVRLEARAAGEATVTVTASDPEGLETQTAFNSYSTDHPPYPIHVTYSSEREPYDGFYAAVDRAIVRWGRVLAPTVPATGVVNRPSPCVRSGHTVPLAHGDTLPLGLNVYMIMPDDLEREGVWASKCFYVEGQAPHGVVGWNPYASWLESWTADGELLARTEGAVLHEIGHILGVGLSDQWYDHIETAPIEPIMGCSSCPLVEWPYHTGADVIATLERMAARTIPEGITYNLTLAVEPTGG